MKNRLRLSVAFVIAIVGGFLPCLAFAESVEDAPAQSGIVVLGNERAIGSTATNENVASSEAISLGESEEDDGESVVLESQKDTYAGDEEAIKPLAKNMPELIASAHVQRIGWMEASRTVEGGWLLGTQGLGLRMESLKIAIRAGGVSYKSHVQGIGWESSWASTGGLSGTTGQAKRLEALRIRLDPQTSADGWSICYRVHVQGIGWMGWATDGAEAGTTGFGKRLEAIEVRVVPTGTDLPSAGPAYLDAGLTAAGHVQGIGWQGNSVGYSVLLGTTGQARRLEAVRIGRPGLDCSGDVVVAAHIQGLGWIGEKSGGAIAGTVGQGRRLEAFRARLTGDLASRFDIWYRVHAQGAGWMAWATDGQAAGTTGLALRIEAIQVALVTKGASAPAADAQGVSVPCVTSQDVQYDADGGSGWMGWRSNGAILGSSSGPSMKRLRIQSVGDVLGSISYEAHLAQVGWCAASTSGVVAGRGGKDIQAVRVSLGGEVSRIFNVWYRAYVRNVGWMGWARNGQDAGSVGAGLPIVALQVQLRSKGQAAPSNAGAAMEASCLDASGAQPFWFANAAQRRIVRSTQTTPWPGPGLCAGWVESVYENAGLGTFIGNACDLYDRYCYSSNLRDLKVGMIVAVRTHTRTSAGSIWGHVGIYVGDGWVVHSVSESVKRVPLQYWIDFYGTTYAPKWGWLGNVNVA